MQASPGGLWLQTSLDASYDRNKPFRSLIPAVIWLCLPSHGAPFRWARPGKEKANQENLCCTEKDGMCPFLSQFYNTVYMETYSIFVHHPIILKEQLFPLLPFL